MLKKIGSALIGFILFPLAEIFSELRIAIDIFRELVVLPFVLPYLYIKEILKAFPQANSFSVIVGSLALSIITATIVYFLNLALLSGHLLILPFAILRGFWNGARTGWDEGLSVVLNHVPSIIMGHPIQNRRQIINELDLPPINLGVENAQEIPPINERVVQIFNDLRLENFGYYSASLTQDERVRLEGDPSPAWKAYENLDRLDIDNCSILQDRPKDNKQIILVFKQYQDGKIWKPIPSFAHIFDNNSFKEWVSSKPVPTHPTSTDPLLNPDEYRRLPTRYRIHPYYSADGKPLSQERHELTLVLRQHLNNLAAARAQAAGEVQHFPSPLHSRGEREAKRRTSQEGQPQFGASN